MMERWFVEKLQALFGGNLSAPDAGHPFDGHVYMVYPPPRGDDGKVHLPSIALTEISTALDSAERRIDSRIVDEEEETVTTDYKRWATESRIQVDLLTATLRELIGEPGWAGYERQLNDLVALKLAWMVDEDGHLIRCRVSAPPRMIPEPDAGYYRSMMEVQVEHGVYERETLPQLATTEPGIVTEGEVE
jgi:hypothetical protein